MGQDIPEEFILPKWTPLYTLKTGMGYRDNVLYSDVNKQASPFTQAGLEFFLMRHPDDWGSMDLFVSFDDIHYLESIDVDKEQLGFCQLRFQWDLDDRNQVEWVTDYVYQDQVLDVSITEEDLNILQVKGHTLATRPGIRWDWVPETWWVTVDVPVERQWFEPPLDNFTEFGTRLVLGHDYGDDSEVQLRYEFTNRDYDNDPELEADGDPIVGTTRAFRQHEFRLTSRHDWDARRRWRSTTRLSWKRNSDNGGGYFNFNRYRASHELRYRTEVWDARAEAGYLYYLYDVQTASPPHDGNRKRDEWFLRLRVERVLTRWLRAYGEVEREQTRSNIDLEDYTINTIVAGLLWEY